MGHTRRAALASLGLAGLEAAVPSLIKKATASSLPDFFMGAGSCPFRLAVINDEITQDFEKACQIVAGDFGLRWIELRSMWNKNVTELDAKEIESARKILHEHNLRVTDIASPLFKTDWPGAPRSPLSEKRDLFHANVEASAQEKLLELCISLCKHFETNRVRCFDYWRLDDPNPYRAAMLGLLLGCGLRRSEVVGLSLDQLQSRGGSLGYRQFGRERKTPTNSTCAVME
jgi:integrase